MIILLVTYRDYFYTNVTYMIFLSNKGLIQCWRQCTTRSSSVRYFCVKSISAWLTENYALFYNNTASIVLNHCLGRGRGKCSILSIFSRLGLFLQFFWGEGGGGGGKGEAYFRFAWNEKSVICSCVPNWFYFVLWSCTAWNIAQAHEKWSFLDKLTVWIIFPKFLGRLRRGWYLNCMQWQQFQI